jgi:hypothetical protein
MISIAPTYERIGLSPSLAQLAFVKSALGDLLTVDELDCFMQCTGRLDPPEAAPEEVDLLAGRKNGKTEYGASPILIHRAVTDDDEPGTYLLVSPSKSDQVRLGWEVINRQLQHRFPGLVARVSDGEGKIYLHNGNVIAIASANFRNLHRPKYKVVAVDEACFFVSDDPQYGARIRCRSSSIQLWAEWPRYCIR